MKMNYGMLWFDNDPKTDLTQKVNRAAAYYLKKYGENPDICFVNPEMMSEKKIEGGEVIIKTNPAILPHHLWIGKETAKKTKQVAV
jgi:hypothetical protein